MFQHVDTNSVLHCTSTTEVSHTDHHTDHPHLFPTSAMSATANAGSRHPHEPQAKHKAAEQQPPFLWGVLRYEDSVEDEWFVVWLLLQLTQQLPGCTARCWDDDGEFLLIEVRQQGECSACFIYSQY